jgi:uncharacterized protein YkwD
MPSRLRALAGLLLVAFVALIAPMSAGADTTAHASSHHQRAHHHKHKHHQKRSSAARSHRFKRGHHRPAPAPRPAPRPAPAPAPAPAPQPAPRPAPAPAPRPAPAPAPAPQPAPRPAPAPAPAPSPAPAPAPTPSGGCANTQSIPTPSNIGAIRASVLCLVNQQRVQAGLSPLSDNGQLQSAAQAHSDDMVARGYFAHDGLDGRNPGARISATGYVARTWGENIAWGSGSLGTPAQIVQNWMNSAGHRANILNGAFAESGIGVAVGTPTGNGSGATYTHDFGAR